MNDVNRFNSWIGALFDKLPFGAPVDFEKKDDNMTSYILYMLARTQSMFEYEGLPDSIPQRVLELFLQINGNVCFHEVDGTLYIFCGGLGGKPDVYYRPTIYTVANPALNYSANLEIGKDCEIISNDSLFLGLMPLFNRYATQLAENDLSIYVAMINSRIIDLITAPDDRTKASAEQFLENVKAGKLGVIAGNAFLEGIQSQPYGTTGHSNTVTQLIELHQYIKAAWFNDLGLNANYNMKREALSTAESQLNDDALLPLVDDMLRCRENGLKRVNEMFGTNITVKLASSWEDNLQEIELEQDALKDDPEQELEPEPEEKPEEEEKEDEPEEN